MFDSFREKGSQFTAVFDTRPFRARGLHLKMQNCKFILVFDVRPSFRAKGLRRLIFRYGNFTLSTLNSCKKVASEVSMQFLHQF